MSDRLRLLAKQAWARVQHLGHDPIESIHKALVYAADETAALPGWADTAYATQRDVALVLAAGPLRLAAIAKQLGLNRRAACLRLRRLRVRGMVARNRHGVYSLAKGTQP